MKPYYSHGGITIYHGEAREVTPYLRGDRTSPRCLVTDPPYGTGWVRTKAGSTIGEFQAERTRPEWDTFEGNVVSAIVGGWAFAAIFCAMSRAEILRKMVLGSGVVHWRKTNARPLGPDREAIVIYPSPLPAGIEFRAYNGDTPFHPCQKPTDLMQWVLGFSPEDYAVVDPFMGSGSTLVAAKHLGREAFGVEREERYCEIAARRLEQEVLDFTASPKGGR